jgi:endonuclease YncB( thermonuclease family)
MKALLLSSILVAGSFPALADTYKITRVIDGDTVEIAVGFLPDPLPPKLSIRVLGIDTPEKAPRAKCEAEAAKAKEASTFTKVAVANARVVDVQIAEWDKYGGRVLGHIILDGQSLSDMLIRAGLARPYHGEAKSSWCE